MCCEILPWRDCHREKEMGKKYGLFEGFQVREKVRESQLTGTHLWWNNYGHARWECIIIVSNKLTHSREESGPLCFDFLRVERKVEAFPSVISKLCESVGVSFLSYRNVRMVVD